MITAWRMFTEGLTWVLPAIPAVLAAQILLYRQRSTRWGRRRASIATLVDGSIAVSLLAVVAATLAPTSGPSHTGLAWGAQVVPLSSVIHVIRNAVDPSVWIRIVVLNIALFVPLGLTLALRLRKVRTVIAVGAVVAAAIESLQLTLPLGRTANIDDLLLNTMGTAVGAVIGHRVARLLGTPGAPHWDAPDDEARWSLPAAAGVLAFAGWAIASWLALGTSVIQPPEEELTTRPSTDDPEERDAIGLGDPGSPNPTR